LRNSTSRPRESDDVRGRRSPAAAFTTQGGIAVAKKSKKDKKKDKKGKKK